MSRSPKSPSPGRAELGGGNTQEFVPLRAGPLTLLFHQGSLRGIRFGNKEVIRRIYAAVRDHNWDTIPGVLGNLQIDAGRDFFHISFDSEHHRGGISFVWHAEILGEPDGTLRFSFDGEARSSFWKNRIGLCILHPIPECAGQPCSVEYADGTRQDAEFPLLLTSQQPVPKIHDLAAISHQVQPGVRAELRFTGDLFEMEDQRNWTDASYKIYSTPQTLPYPVEIHSGTRVQQNVTLKLLGPSKITAPPSSEEAPVRLSVDFGTPRPLCPVGVGSSSFRELYSDQLVGQLRALNLSHLRVDVRLSDPRWTEKFEAGAAEAQKLDLPLELALTLPASDRPPLADLLAFLQSRGLSVARWIILTEGARTTTPECFQYAKAQLAGCGELGAGTDADFFQLGLAPIPWNEAAFVSWSMNPQVHAFDNLSIAETPASIPWQMQSARANFPGRKLVVSPITLKPRFNPVATGPEELSAGALPRQADPRQGTTFAQAWTLAMLKHLAEAGADSATFFETVGWRGLIEREKEPFLNRSTNSPGDPFPLYYTFFQFGAMKGGQVLPSDSTDPDRVVALVLQKGAARKFMVGNLSPRPQQFICDDMQIQGTLSPYEVVTYSLPV